MWRLSNTANTIAVPVSAVNLLVLQKDLTVPIAHLVNNVDEELVCTDAQLVQDNLTYVAYAEYDLSTNEQQLNDIYNDIKNGIFPLYAHETTTILKKYANFNVNIKSAISGQTLLHVAIYKSTTNIAKSLVYHPLMKRSTLKECLAYINNPNNNLKLNKSQQIIKHYIENALLTNNHENIESYEPSAPPIHDESYEPSAPPMDGEFYNNEVIDLST